MNRMRDVSLTFKLVSYVFISVTLGVAIIVVTNYASTFKSMEQAAGHELFGCANITTGLLNTDDLLSLMEGNKQMLEKVRDEITWTIEKKQIFQSSYILNLDGTILVADKKSSKNGFQIGSKHPISEETLQRVASGELGVFSEIYLYRGMDRLTGLAPIYKDHDESKEIIAINAIDFDASIVQERTIGVVKNTILAGLILPILLTIITFFVMKSLVRHIARITTQSEKVSRGDLRLGKTIVNSNDEVGKLIKNFNLMVKSLKNLVMNMMKSSDQLSLTSNDVSVSAVEASKGIEQISSFAQEVAAGSERQVKSLEKTEDMISTISTYMTKITEKITNVEQAADKTLNIAATGNEIVNQAIKEMNLIGKAASSTGKAILSLDKKSQEINKIISMIADISNQTNLLALNAAIEAARAGEHGKGFAVVADEVRKLAEQSGDSSTKIGQLIKEIQIETAEAVQAMSSGDEVVKKGIATVENAKESFKEIAASVDGVANQIGETSESILDIDKQIQEMVISLKEIATISRETAARTQDIAGSAEEQNAFIEEMNAAMHQLASMSDELNKLVRSFQLD